jgi:hypothetical protein
MTKNEKIDLLARAIIMLNQTSEHKNHDIYKLAEKIDDLVNGNPVFAMIGCLGASYEDARKVVVDTLKKEKIIELEE